MKVAFGLPLTGAMPEETGVELYPSQDELPAGSKGVGNLIALPWQKGPREDGTSVLLSLNGRPVQSQGQALADLYRAVAGE
jgi:hypothetical protein